MPTVSPASKTERLLNLVICLLYTRQPLAKQAIRSAVPQYGAAPTDEAFDRMFERDKDELRDLGIPLRTEPLDIYFDDEPGYRIDRREYALPEIGFTPHEMAVLGLASRTWQQASLGAPAAQALRKLRAQDVERDAGSVIGLEPRVRTQEAAFEPVKDAALKRQPITFAYRRGAEGSTRRLQPWAVTSWHGHWYVTGFDLDRDDARVFRLSRIEGKVSPLGSPGSYEVPAEHDAVAMISTANPDAPTSTARLRVRAGAGHLLRRGAVSCTPGTEWDQVVLTFVDTEALAAQICGYGPAVVVLEPPELLEAVRSRLQAVAQAHTGAQR